MKIMETQHATSVHQTTLHRNQISAPEGVRVAILICTFNGDRFLEEQLGSIITQTHKNWVIYASDDGSNDTTLQILQRYRVKLGADRLFILEGPRQGFGKNFLSLINNPKIVADYFSFSDQDDIWHKDKLEKAILTLTSLNNDKPSLYCSRTRLIDASGKVIGYSPLFSKTPSFENALVQSIAGANTMLMNNTSRKLLWLLDDQTPIVAHDWLAYLLICGCGGTVIYDAQPTLDYRQHENNVIGANANFIARASRIRKMFSGRFQEWTSSNLAALASIEKHLTAENKNRLQNFKLARSSGLLNRIRLMKRTGIYRQTLNGNISLKFAIIFNKI